MKRILGIDSETVNDADGRARCTLIACSDGSHIERDNISTDEALHFITRRKGELWTFFGDYDVNFWLRDMPQSRLDRLRISGWATCGRWRVHHIPRRLFEVWDLLDPHYSRIYDAFPFVQTSFVGWLRAWDLADAKTIARIAEMKARRADFSKVSRAKILRYTQDEVRLIAKGVGILKERIAAAGCTPSQWLGPGAVAAHVMRRYKVQDSLPRKTHPMAERAYYGGRIETSAVGILRLPLYYYDITSAYPAACLGLPCFRHGKWKRTKTPRGASLVYVRWKHLADVAASFGPFPLRPKKYSSLRYYRQGRGWYWLDEVVPWLDHKAYDVKLGVCYQWHQTCDHRPLDWIADLYAKRAELKAKGDPSEYAFKLILNSIYGKFAQRVGRRPFYCPEWAGLITARTRARLTEMMGDDALLLATDGVLTRSPRPLDEPGLGAWTLEGTYDGADLWQPGFYVLSDGKLRTRGYSRVDVDTGALRHAWKRDGLQALPNISKTYVVGYRLATSQNRMGDLCRWVTDTTELSLNPLPRRYLGRKLRGMDAWGTLPPHSIQAELGMGLGVIPRDRVGEYQEDGCPEGFIRD